MTMTARDTLTTIAIHANDLRPETRGAAIARTLGQLADIAGDLPLDLADALAGYELLSRPCAEVESAQITARRKTCGELARICLSYVGAYGDARKLMAVLDRVAAHFAPSSDPREQAILYTCLREVKEIYDAIERAKGGGPAHAVLVDASELVALSDGGALLITYVPADAHPMLMSAELNDARARGGLVFGTPGGGTFTIRRAL